MIKIGRTLSAIAIIVFAFSGIFAQDDDMMMEDFLLFASLNPADLENDAIISLSPDLMGSEVAFDGFADPVTSVQSLDFTSDGTAYVTFDAADGAGGVTAISGLTGMDDMMDMMSPILGDATTLAAPKGIEIIESMDLLLVANFGAGNIAVFSMDDSGDVAPALTFGTGDAEGSIWDVLYVEETDTLYAAGTAGDLLAYDNFSQDTGSTDPTRIIAPSNADLEKVTINLHAMVYVAELDTMIVTDVGAADDNTDGHLYAIPDVSTADGNTAVSLHILGPDSLLGNPVDAVWDGSGLYVAEKANDAILYFGDLLDMNGMMDMTPTIVLDTTKPESLALYMPDMMMDDMDEMADGCTVTPSSNVNLRGGPSTLYGLRGALTTDETPVASGQANGTDGFVWYQLESTAWVRSDLVTISGACDNLPVVAAPPLPPTAVPAPAQPTAAPAQPSQPEQPPAPPPPATTEES